MTPADEGWGFAAAPETLVRVHVLVSYRGDFGRVSQHSGYELAADLREVVLRRRIEERVGISFE